MDQLTQITNRNNYSDQNIENNSSKSNNVFGKFLVILAVVLICISIITILIFNHLNTEFAKVEAWPFNITYLTIIYIMFAVLFFAIIFFLNGLLFQDKFALRVRVPIIIFNLAVVIGLIAYFFTVQSLFSYFSLVINFIPSNITLSFILVFLILILSIQAIMLMLKRIISAKYLLIALISFPIIYVIVQSLNVSFIKLISITFSEYSLYLSIMLFTIFSIIIDYKYSSFPIKSKKIIIVSCLLLPFIGLGIDFVQYTIKSDFGSNKKVNYLQSDEDYKIFYENHNSNITGPIGSVDIKNPQNIINYDLMRLFYTYGEQTDFVTIISGYKISPQQLYLSFIVVDNPSEDLIKKATTPDNIYPEDSSKDSIYILNTQTNQLKKITQDKLEVERNNIIWNQKSNKFIFTEQEIIRKENPNGDIKENIFGRDYLLEQIDTPGKIGIYDIESQKLTYINLGQNYFNLGCIDSEGKYLYAIGENISTNQNSSKFISFDNTFGYSSDTKISLVKIDLLSGEIKILKSFNIDFGYRFDTNHLLFFTPDNKKIIVSNDYIYDVDSNNISKLNSDLKQTDIYYEENYWSKDLHYLINEKESGQLVLYNTQTKGVKNIGGERLKFGYWLDDSKRFIYTDENSIYSADINGNIQKLINCGFIYCLIY